VGEDKGEDTDDEDAGATTAPCGEHEDGGGGGRIFG
jgi:hypothetical protein